MCSWLIVGRVKKDILDHEKFHNDFFNNPSSEQFLVLLASRDILVGEYCCQNRRCWLVLRSRLLGPKGTSQIPPNGRTTDYDSLGAARPGLKGFLADRSLLPASLRSMPPERPLAFSPLASAMGNLVLYWHTPTVCIKATRLF